MTGFTVPETCSGSKHRTIFSVAENYFFAARDELLALFPAADATVERIGPDAGRMTSVATISEIASACRDTPVVFVRHLMRECERILTADTPRNVNDAAQQFASLVGSDARPRDVALQVWSSGALSGDHRTDELWRAVASALQARGYGVARANREWTFSVLRTPEWGYVGLNPAQDGLTDWPGGRVALAKRGDQISRSEFKLEELFRVFDIPLPTSGIALDLGASPGGWTRLLRQRGLTVWAVDPGALDSRLDGDVGVRHLRTTAGAFLARNQQTFDLVVNDMRMESDRSCQLMVDAAPYLRPGAVCIVTLKLDSPRPHQSVDAAIATLQRRYEILHARQLFHNRNEVTIVGRR